MDLRRIGVIAPGNGIALMAGLDVTLVDISDATVQRGLKTRSASLERPLRKGAPSSANPFYFRGFG